MCLCICVYTVYLCFCMYTVYIFFAGFNLYAILISMPDLQSPSDHGVLWGSRLSHTPGVPGTTCQTPRQAEEGGVAWLWQSSKERFNRLDRVGETQHYLDLEGTIYHTMSLFNISLSKCHTEEGSVTSRTLQRTTLSPPMSVQRLLQRWAKRSTGTNWRKEIRKFLQVGIDIVFLQLCRWTNK